MIIKVKRGSSKPTTSNLSNIGELAFDTNHNALYVRGNSRVVRVGAMELVEQFESSSNAGMWLTHNFDKDYIYKVHIVASTNATDTSNTYFNYAPSAGASGYSGSYICTYTKDSYSSVSHSSSKNMSNFWIYDCYSNSTSARYATTKVIDFDVSPTQESYTTSTYAWMINGYSACASSDQANGSISIANFTHIVDGTNLGAIYVNPGLDAGSYKTFTATIYRMRRR